MAEITPRKGTEDKAKSRSIRLSGCPITPRKGTLEITSGLRVDVVVCDVITPRKGT